MCAKASGTWSTSTRHNSPACRRSIAVSMAKKKPGDAVDNAVRISAKLSAAALAQSEPIVGEAVKSGQVQVVAARYDIATGQVEFLK